MPRVKVRWVAPVVSAAGIPIVMKKIELTIEQAAVITDSNSVSTPRPIKKGELLTAIEVLKQAILKDTTLFQ